MIYFISASSGGPIKIGMSGNVKRRLYSLQGAHHQDLVLLGSFEGGRKEEDLVHRAFCEHYIRGEWFQRSTTMLSVIDKWAEAGFESVKPILELLAKGSTGIARVSRDGTAIRYPQHRDLPPFSEEIHSLPFKALDGMATNREAAE